MQPKLIVTMKDLQRFKIIKEVIEKKLKATQGSQILGLSYIHFLRLKKKVNLLGLPGLLRKSHPSSKKIPHSKAKVIAGLYQDLYYDFNILHFKDKLADVHKIFLSYESIRQILIAHHLHQPKKKKIVHRRRRRMPKEGMLVQMDSSQHNWLECIAQKWWLVAMIDDAINEVPYARFFPSDSTLANMHVIRKFIEKKGLFMCLYVDYASHFRGPRHKNTPHYDNKTQETYSQIERALDELDINIINASSCQAKGRIERLFGFFQDRLIKELRLAGIKDYDQANKYLINKFLPWYNKKYTRKAESIYLALPKDKNLDTIFSVKKERTVNSDNTVQLDGQVIQIPPTDIRLSFAKAKVDVCISENNQIWVLYKDQIIAESKVDKKSKIVKKQVEEAYLNSKELVPCYA